MQHLPLLAVLGASPAAAHQMPSVHAHPHGIEAVVIGLAVAGVAWLVWKVAR